MENNLIPVDNKVTVLPDKGNYADTQFSQGKPNPSEKMAEDMFKTTTDMIKEGAATAKDNRIIRKKIVESGIETAGLDLEVQKAEYDRVVKKLNDPQTQPNERARCEKRAEAISDRIHEVTQAHRDDMRQNTPPPQKGVPTWGWIVAICLSGLAGFAGGRYYQSRH